MAPKSVIVPGMQRVFRFSFFSSRTRGPRILSNVFHGLCIGAALTALACGKTPPPVAAKEKVAEEKKEELPPLEVVNAPANLVAKVRIADSLAISKQLNADLQTEVDLSKMLSAYSSLLSEDSVRVFRLDSAFELVAAIPSQPMQKPQWGWSIGVTSSDDLLQVLDELQIPVMEHAVGEFHFNLKEKFECVVGRSFGVAAQRLACVTPGDGGSELQAYQLRGLPQEKLGDKEIYLELNLQPVREVYSAYLPMLRQLAAMGARRNASGDERFDSALELVALALADEVTDLSKDWQGMSLSLDMDQEQYALQVDLMLQSGASWISRYLGQLSERSSVAPERLEQWVDRSSTASYWVGVDSALADSLLSHMSRLASAYAAKEGMADEQVAQLSSVIEAMRLALRPSYSARIQTGESKQEGFVSLYGIEASEAELTSLLSSLQALLDGLPEKQLSDVKELLPKVRQLKANDPELNGLKEPLEALSVYRIELNSQLQRRTQLKDLLGDAVVQGIEQPDDSDTPMFLAVYPIGELIELRLSASLSQLKAVEEDSKTLRNSKSQLRAIFNEKAAWAGFFSLASLDLFADMPSEKASPIADFRMKVEQDGQQMSATSRLIVPRQFLKDLRQKMKAAEQ